jgi:hypothetical protein
MHCACLSPLYPISQQALAYVWNQMGFSNTPRECQTPFIKPLFQERFYVANKYKKSYDFSIACFHVVIPAKAGIQIFLCF